MEISIIIIMILLNSLFAAYELALASVSLGRLKLLADQKKRGAIAALVMKNRMEASLAVVQIGITLFGAIAAATGGAGAEETISPVLEAAFNISSELADILSIAIIVVPLSAMTIIIGELVPKSIALRNPELVCLKLSPFMKIFTLFVYPAMLFLEKITKIFVHAFEKKAFTVTGTQYELGLAELRAQAQTLRTSRIIGDEQERIILGASTLTRIKVENILVPQKDIAMLDVNAPLSEHFIVVHRDAYSRFPVMKKAGDIQSIIGYVNLKELIFLAKAHPQNPTLRQIVRPLISIPPEISIGTAFSQMMKEHVHLALVKDSNGIVKGIITLEDILEEIVGDIQDEFDRFPRHIIPSGQNWIVGGGATLLQLRDIIGAYISEGQKPETTFADWLLTKAPNHFKGGDVIKINGIRILIRKMRRQKVFEAMIILEKT